MRHFGMREGESVIVKHNLTAMNSNRMLGLTAASQAEATEKLSSGYRINRAADDAAGLAISEKMRRQIRGLTQASLNASDGISMIQTAEGALNEVHDMLHRMTELTVKAANGTLSPSDRDAVQNEIDQLVREVDRVSTSTKFNETYLLSGGTGTNGRATFQQAEETIGAICEDATPIPKIYPIVDQETGIIRLRHVDTRGGLAHDGSGIDYSDPKWQRTMYHSISFGPFGTDKTQTVYKVVVEAYDSNQHALYPISVDDMIAHINSPNNPGNPNNDRYYKAFRTMEELMAAMKEDFRGMVKEVNWSGTPKKMWLETFADARDPLEMSFHVGADSREDNKVYMNIAAINARGLGLNGLTVADDTGDAATEAIDVISDALERVSAQRACLGAIQNRLEHTIANLDNVVENTTAAESQIRDTDMAAQMVEYSNNQILAQAGQAMLAQSNQANQGVLSLLG